MRDVFFAKRCDAMKLHQELIAGGFDIYGVGAGDEAKTVVHLKDTETKDPKAIVEAHKYIEPKTEEETKAEQIEWLKTATDSQKIEFLLEQRGLKEK